FESPGRRRRFAIADVIRGKAQLLDARLRQIDGVGQRHRPLRLTMDLEKDQPTGVRVKARLYNRIAHTDRRRVRDYRNALHVQLPVRLSRLESLNTGGAEIDDVMKTDHSVRLVLAFEKKFAIRRDLPELADGAPGDDPAGPVEAFAVDRKAER